MFKLRRQSSLSFLRAFIWWVHFALTKLKPLNNLHDKMVVGGSKILVQPKSQSFDALRVDS